MTDSTIFEDPAIVFENMGDPPLTNINNYLVSGKDCDFEAAKLVLPYHETSVNCLRLTPHSLHLY